MQIIFKIFIIGGAIAIGIISLLMVPDMNTKYMGFGFACLLLVAGCAPQVFKKLALSIGQKFGLVKKNGDSDVESIDERKTD